MPAVFTCGPGAVPASTRRASAAAQAEAGAPAAGRARGQALPEAGPGIGSGGGGGVIRGPGRFLRVLLAPWAVAAVVSFAVLAHEAAAHTGAGAQPTDPVHIPDANLRAKVEAALNKASGEAITHAEMAGLRTCIYADPTGCLQLVGPFSDQFNVAGRIHDLTGLEHATGLTRVRLRYHPVSDLTPLAGLTSLTELTLIHADVQDLTRIAGLTNLQILQLPESHRISDLTPLAGLTSLRQLSLTVNRVSDLTPLAGLTGLTRLYLSDNRISDIAPLAGLTSLEQLTLAGNRITSIEPLRGMTSLTRLTLQENYGLRDLSPLSGLTGIYYFDLDAIGVEDISPLVLNSGLSSGDIVSLDDVTTLNADAAGHIATLRGRGVTVWGGDVEEARQWQVQNVRATPGPERLTVTWGPLPDAENPKTRTKPQGYKVQWRSGAQHWSDTVTYKHSADYADVPGMDRHRVVSGVNTTSYTIPGLTPGVAYTVRIKPDFGTFYAGAPSDEVTATPRAPRPGKVTGVEVTPGAGSLAVSWTAVSGVDGYRVQWKSGDQDYDGSDESVRQATVAGGDTTSRNISGLIAGTEYTVRVIAARAHARDGLPSDDVTGTPAQVAVDADVTSGVRSLIVSWRTVADAVRYQVQWRPDTQEYGEDPDQEDHCVPTPQVCVSTGDVRTAGAGGSIPAGLATTYTISNLDPAVTYRVRVTPILENGVMGRAAEVTGTPHRKGAAIKAVVRVAPAATAVEGEAAELRVALDEPSEALVTVGWTAEDGTARAGEDYLAAGGRLTFQPGEREMTLRVETLDDRRVEPSETFRVRLMDSMNAAPAPEAASGTVTITDDDTAVVRVAPAATAVEGEAAELRVALDEPAEALVTVGWTAEDGTARAGEDYLAAGGRLTFQPGEREMTLRVETLDDRRVEPSETFRVRLMDSMNAAPAPEAASGTVTITDDDTGPARARAMGMVLAGMGRWVAADAVDVIEGRLAPRAGAEAALGGRALDLAALGSGKPARSAAPGAQAASGGSSGAADPRAAARAAGYRYRHDFGRARRTAGSFEADGLRPWTPREPAEDVPVTELLSRSRFDLPLRRQDAAAGGASGGTTGWRVWGQGAVGGFDSRPEAGFRVDGDLAGGYLGLDYRPKHDVLLGMAISLAEGDFDYEIDEVTTGALDLEMRSVLPYAHWKPRSDLGVWGMLGAGQGDAELKDEAGRAEADLTMRMAAGGLRREMAAWRGIDLAWKADAFLSELETDAAEGLPKASGDARRLRLRLEGRRQWEISPVSQMMPSLEVGGRWDGGRAETGLGMEVGGGLAYSHATLGLEVEARGRFLLAHREDAFDEWGGSLTAKLDPGQPEEGPWMRIAPGWGQEGSRMAQIWDGRDVFRAVGGPGETLDPSPDRLELEAGYGQPTRARAGLLTSYAGLSMAGSKRIYRVGRRLKLESRANLGVEGRQSVQAGETPKHEVTLYLSLPW